MLNNISLMGRFTDDPEVRQTPNGVSVVSFTLAVDNDHDRESAPNWIDCVAWRSTAEFIGKHFKKGAQMALKGSVQTRTYQDKQGNNRKATEVVVEQVYFAGGERQ